jgi:hypothetical protein
MKSQQHKCEADVRHLAKSHMSSNNWHKLKEEIYYWDGSLCDIYVLETTQEDWGNWIDLVNQKYSVRFYNGQQTKTESAIDKKAVFDYQGHKTDLLSSAVIKVEQITVNCRYFFLRQIENDIDPREIATFS